MIIILSGNQTLHKTRGDSNRTGHTWAHIRRHTQRIHQVTLEGPDGTAEHLTRPTGEQNQLFAAAGLAPPKRLTSMTPAA